MGVGAVRLAGWIKREGDNAGLPYAIIDKSAARLFLFEADGTSSGSAPVLLGIALGDDATPGIGSKDLSKIGPAERTTPAGRFLARYGRSYAGKRVLWVDYSTAVAIHPLARGTPKDRRTERLLSQTPEDNRITYGCINVPPPFYQSNVEPMFRSSGGIVYIMPETKPLEEVFPRLKAGS